MIDQNIAWLLIQKTAIKAFLTKAHWHSLKENAPYRLIDVKSDRLIIARLNGGNNDE